MTEAQAPAKAARKAAEEPSQAVADTAAMYRELAKAAEQWNKGQLQPHHAEAQWVYNPTQMGSSTFYSATAPHEAMTFTASNLVSQ